MADTNTLQSDKPQATYRLHWRSLRTGAQGQGTATFTLEQARQITADLNRDDAGYGLHHWYVMELAAPAVTIEPETDTELGQLITTEWEAAQPGVPMCHLPDCLDGAEPGRDFCARHLPRWTGEQIIAREG